MPADFRGFVRQLADGPISRRSRRFWVVTISGPKLLAKAASCLGMANADDLIKSYVAAGFKKIHLDCSMSCQEIIPFP
ncbi:class II D-tagatose-bisphosphate aldolase non-catalytic subunit [Shigella flexneri]